MKVLSQLVDTEIGDNYVISQQTARACLKYLINLNGLPASAEYIVGPRSVMNLSGWESWRDSAVQLNALESRARHAIHHLKGLVQQGIAWKDLNMECVGVTRAHIDVFLLRSFIDTISAAEDESIKPILTKFCTLVHPVSSTC